MRARLYSNTPRRAALTPPILRLPACLPDAARKRELVQAVTAAAPELVRFVAQHFSQRFAAYAEAATSATKRALVRVCVGAIGALFRFTSTASIEPGTVESVIGLLVRLLQDRPLRIPALDALAGLIGRYQDREQSSAVEAVFSYVPELFSALALDDEASTDALEHMFRLQLIAELVSLGLFQLVVFRRAEYARGDEPVSGLHEHFHGYMLTMLGMTEHASLAVQLLLNPLFVSFTRSHIVPASELPSSELLGRFYDVALKAMLFNPASMAPGSLTAQLCEIEYDSAEALAEARLMLRAQGSSLLRELTLLDGAHTFNFAVQYMGSVLGELEALRQRGELASVTSKDSDLYCAVFAASLIMDTTIASMDARCFISQLSAPSSPPSPTGEAALSLVERSSAAQERLGAELARREHVRALMREALVALLAFQPSESALLMDRYLHMLTPFFHFIGDTPELVPDLFNLLFDYVTYRPGEARDSPLDVATLDDAVLNVRIRACRVLLNMALHAGKTLSDIVDQVWGQIQALEAAGQLLLQERLDLYKMCLLLAEDVAEEFKAGLIGAILEPVLAQWAAPDLVAVFSSPARLADGIGLTATSDSLLEPDNVAFRALLFFLVETVDVVVKWSRGWTRPLLLPLYDQLLPPLFYLIAGLHGLYADELCASINQDFVVALQLPVEASGSDVWDEVLDVHELRQCRVSAGASTDPATGEPFSIDAQLSLVQWWLSRIQSSLYNTLGALFDPDEFFALQGIATALHESVFAGADRLPLHHLARIISRIVTPLRTRCPRELRASVTDPLLYEWLRGTAERLTDEWEVHAEALESRDTATAQELEVEIAHENALRALTLTLATQMRGLVTRLPRGLPSAEDVEANLVLIEPMRSLFVETAVKMLAWDAPEAQCVASGVVARLVCVLADREEAVELALEVGLPGMLHVLSVAEEEYDTRRVTDDIALVYQTLAPVAGPRLRQIFTGLPGVDERRWAEFEAAVPPGPVRDDRAFAFRELLHRVISANTLRALHRIVDDGPPMPAKPISDMRGRYGGKPLVVS